MIDRKINADIIVLKIRSKWHSREKYIPLFYYRRTARIFRFE